MQSLLSETFFWSFFVIFSSVVVGQGFDLEHGIFHLIPLHAQDDRGLQWNYLEALRREAVRENIPDHTSEINFQLLGYSL